MVKKRESTALATLSKPVSAVLGAAVAAAKDLTEMKSLVPTTPTPRLAAAVRIVKMLEKATADLYSTAREELMNRCLDEGSDNGDPMAKNDKGFMTLLEDGTEVHLDPRETVKERPGALAWLASHFTERELGELTKTTVAINKDALERYVKAGKIKISDVNKNLFEIKETWFLTVKEDKK